MSRQTLLFALFCLAGLAAAQDFPIDPPDVVDAAKPPASAETVDGVPPAGIARPELLTPAVELPTPLAILDRLVVPGTRLQLEWRPAGGISNAEIPSPVIVARGAKPRSRACASSSFGMRASSSSIAAWHSSQIRKGTEWRRFGWWQLMKAFTEARRWMKPCSSRKSSAR